jgi:hypothetical protein
MLAQPKNVWDQRSGKKQGRASPRSLGPVDTFTSDFWPLELQEKECLLFEPLSLLSFVTAALEDQDRLRDLGYSREKRALSQAVLGGEQHSQLN